MTSASASSSPTAHPTGAPAKEFSFYQCVTRYKNLLGQHTDHIRYDPSVPAAAIFAALFLGTTVFHCWQAFKKRTFYFIPLIIGGHFEWIGYICRIISHYNLTSMSIFIMQTLLLLLPPSLFAASIYMVLGRLILFTNGENAAPIRANWLTKIFVIGDIFSFLVQAGGGSMMAKASSQNLGKNLVIIGLILQILFFGLFIITSVIFHRRMVRSPTSSSLRAPWQKYLYALYGASLLILVRSLFRIFEFAGGHNGKLMSSEVYIYVFDAVLMWGVMVVFNGVHPGEIIGRRGDLKGAVPLGGLESGSESYLSGDRR
ncbi:RTA1 like protein-domain-containing protein [Rhexocercosporidium sp. MPI-PUGE-AT-0058]|nr:RTA1 like protein-domain-containing protein [Rhexocercosporidium sp. MPI-PUGE-AT-0058]